MWIKTTFFIGFSIWCSQLVTLVCINVSLPLSRSLCKHLWSKLMYQKKHRRKYTCKVRSYKHADNCYGKKVREQVKLWHTSKSLHIFFLLFCGLGSKGGRVFTSMSAASANRWIWLSIRTGVRDVGEPGPWGYSPKACKEEKYP